MLLTVLPQIKLTKKVSFVVSSVASATDRKLTLDCLQGGFTSTKQKQTWDC